MVANILSPDTATLGMGSIGQNSTFSEHGQQHGSKYFASPLPWTLGMGSVGQNSAFSKHGQRHTVAYQIKGNHECSNMVTNILLLDTPPPTPPKVNLRVGEMGFTVCFVIYEFL